MLASNRRAWDGFPALPLPLTRGAALVQLWEGAGRHPLLARSIHYLSLPQLRVWYGSALPWLHLPTYLPEYSVIQGERRFHCSVTFGSRILGSTLTLFDSHPLQLRYPPCQAREVDPSLVHLHAAAHETSE